MKALKVVACIVVSALVCLLPGLVIVLFVVGALAYMLYDVLFGKPAPVDDDEEETP